MKRLLSILFTLSILMINLGPFSVKAQEFDCSAVTEIPSTECEALVALYNSTNGDNWIDHTNWLVTNTPSDWYGVGISIDHVYIVSLSNNQLSGTIPTELGNLSNLEALYLDQNQLIGSIPSSFANLDNLLYLLLRDNQLSGSIPEALGDLINLQYLHLYRNQLSGSIPEALGNLLNLRDLSLSENEFSGNIPDSFGNLMNLRNLNLFDNQLSGNIPDAISNLINLQYLYIFENSFSGSIPLSFTQLTNLESFIFYGTNLCEPDYLEFQTWKDSVVTWSGTEVVCSSSEFSCSSVTEIPSSECEALVALYNSTNGDNWTDNTNWLETFSPSDWYGVSVTNNHVTFIELDNNSLTGFLPSQIGQLTALFSLHLQFNQIGGIIPIEIGDLQNLNALILIGNKLTGSIPQEIGQLSNLYTLSLDLNELSGQIPAEIGQLNNLDQLSLSSNQLTGSIPAQIGDMSNIRNLSLKNNLLTGNIPYEISQLSKLEVLSLQENQLTGSIPPELGNMINLHVIDLYSNQLEGPIPLSFTNLINIFEFYFYDTNLCEPTDPEFIAWKENIGFWQGTDVICLEGFTCSNVTEIPPTECEALVALYNSTDGANWTNNTNWLVTNTPSDWYDLEIENNHVKSIMLYKNNLSGFIPPELGTLTYLDYLLLQDNSISGPIPTELGDLYNLTSLNLSFNLLNGPIPKELGDLINLTQFNLAFNQLSGEIPIELRNLNNLLGLYLNDNQLTGSIPSELGEIKTLVRLDLENNLLTGSIPSELGTLNNLVGLLLSNNTLTGSIPTSLGDLNNLFDLYLDNNQLSGSIPSQLGELTNLGFLSLSGNHLSGDIPEQLGEMGNLWVLWLNDNLLTGSIPFELGNLQNLGYLDLSHNLLTDAVPAELGYLNNLTDLYLNNNQLLGSVPMSFIGLTHLDRFYFYDTNICEPDDPDFLAWKSTVFGWQGTEIFCAEVFSCSSVTEIPPTECDALVALYNSTNGDNWTENTNWLVTSTPSDWYGVSVFQQHVINLNLNENNLSGSIPGELGDLPNLQSLWLNLNDLNDPIPPELGDLSNLLYLILSDNQLSETIPSELEKLSKLQGLWLNGNQLIGTIPSTIGSLANLTWLDIAQNLLTGQIPPGLGNLTNLEYLNLYSNQLTGPIPLNFVNLTNLLGFYFYDTTICEPTDPEFLTWKSTVDFWNGTGEFCVPTIHGQVWQSDLSGVSEVRISVGTNASTFTDENGYYFLPVETPGVYSIYAEKSGYCLTPSFWSANIQSGSYEFNYLAISGDCISPSQIEDLNAVQGTIPNTIKLSWTSPGDDGLIGTASQYDIRYSANEINDFNWSYATQITGEPTPLIAGTTQTMTVTLPYPEQRYYFAIKAIDESGNWSEISNSPSAFSGIQKDTIPPGYISDLKAFPGPQPGQVLLTWTAPPDDANDPDSGPVDHYSAKFDLVYTSGIIDWFDSAYSLGGEPEPGPVGSKQSMIAYDHDNMIPGKIYGFVVQAIDENPANRSYSNFVSIKVPSSTTTYPDLKADLTNVSPTSLNPGDTINISFRVSNNEVVDATSNVTKVYLKISENSTSDISKICDKTLSISAYSTSDLINCTYTIPQTSAGTYYIVVEADADKVITEQDENNNIDFQQITIGNPSGEPQFDLSIKGIEVTQGVQFYHFPEEGILNDDGYGDPPMGGNWLNNNGDDWTDTGPGNNEVNLVQGRTTIARVYLNINPSTYINSVTDINVSVIYNVGDGWIEAEPLDDGVGYFSSSLSELSRYSSNLSADFKIYKSNLEGISLSVKAMVDPEYLIPEKDETNNTYTESMSLLTKSKLTIGLLPIHITYNSDSLPPKDMGVGDITDSGVLDQINMARAMLPIELNFLSLDTVFINIDEDWCESAKNSDPLNDNYLRIIQPGFPGIDILVGVVPNFVSQCYGYDGMADDIGIGNSLWIKDDAHTSSLSHELSHLIPGLTHPNKNEEDIGSISPDDACGAVYKLGYWPYEGFTSREVGVFSSQVGVYDIGDLFWYLNSPYDLKVPSAYFQDLMSYCSYKWPTPYTWESWLNKPQPTSYMAENNSTSIKSSSYLQISGRIKEDNSVVFDPIWISQQSSDISNIEGEYCIKSYGSINNELSEKCFSLNFLHHEYGQIDPDNFFVTLPYDPTISKISVEKNDVNIANIYPSSTVPSVQLIFPTGGENISQPFIVSWKGDDIDQDELFYQVQYSSDNGNNWSILGYNLTHTYLEIDPRNLTGTSQGIFKVIVSDGFFNSGDQIQNSIIIQKNPPTVKIENPKINATFYPGIDITFTGFAFDNEDSEIIDSNYYWESSLEGYLGSGQSITVSNLQPGVHKISLLVTDSDGMSAIDSIYIDVQSDLDNDGISDQWEISKGMNPYIDDSKEDPDGDGLINKLEFQWNTDPFSFDTDLDDIDDLSEINQGTNPTITNTQWINIFLPLISK